MYRLFQCRNCPECKVNSFVGVTECGAPQENCKSIVGYAKPRPRIGLAQGLECFDVHRVMYDVHELRLDPGESRLFSHPMRRADDCAYVFVDYRVAPPAHSLCVVEWCKQRPSRQLRARAALHWVRGAIQWIDAATCKWRAVVKSPDNRGDCAKLLQGKWREHSGNVMDVNQVVLRPAFLHQVQGQRKKIRVTNGSGTEPGSAKSQVV